MFYAHFLRVSITQKWCNVSITKSVVAEPVAIVVDLRNGIEIGFEIGEILRFKMCCFEQIQNPHPYYIVHLGPSVGTGLKDRNCWGGWSHQDIKRSKAWPIWGSCGARRLGTRTEHNSGCRGWTSVGHKSIWSELSRAAVVLGGGGLFPLSEGLTQMGF